MLSQQFLHLRFLEFSLSDRHQCSVYGNGACYVFEFLNDGTVIGRFVE